MFRSAGTVAKRLKLSNENECSVVLKNDAHSIAESGFYSEIDFSTSAATTSRTEFSLSPAKRKILAPRRASFQSISSSISSNDLQQQFSSSSSGYGSLLCSSTSSSLSLSRSSRTPKKRKVEEGDENFYNSYQFISPLKIRKKDDKNCAKLVLKEKSSSENVILSSTPIHSNNHSGGNKINNKWQKFRSFHPEKLNFGKSVDDEPIEKTANFGNVPRTPVDRSLDLSSFDFSNTSFNLTASVQHDIPTNIQNLCTGDIKQQQKEQKEKENQILQQSSIQITKSDDSVKAQGTIITSFSSSSIDSISSERKKFFNGLNPFNIVGRLNSQHDIAVGQILSYLDDEALHNLSCVSKDYRNMIASNKIYETKLQNYLKAYKAIKENKSLTTIESTQYNNVTASEKKRKKAFGNHNTNQKMVLRKKPPTNRLHEMNQVMSLSRFL